MKKIYRGILVRRCFYALPASLPDAAKNPREGLTPVTLNVVAHSIFYAPQIRG